MITENTGAPTSIECANLATLIDALRAIELRFGGSAVPRLEIESGGPGYTLRLHDEYPVSLRFESPTHSLGLPQHRGHKEYIRELKAFMRSNAITYGALARAMGVDMSQVSRWMNLRVEPRISSIAQINRALASILRDRAEAAGTRPVRQASAA